MMLGHLKAVEAFAVGQFDELQPLLQHVAERRSVRIQMVENSELHAGLPVTLLPADNRKRRRISSMPRRRVQGFVGKARQARVATLRRGKMP